LRCLVGIDDTDSARGFCTTYLAFRIACDLADVLSVRPYPRLVRLNPNIPFKTRGNAAVCLPVVTQDPDLAFKSLREKVSELADVAAGANSGLVLLEDKGPDPELAALYERAVSGVVNPARARKLLREKGARFATLGNGMGLVGAAASLGFAPASDHTFELISYRSRGRWGTRRVIDPASVMEMDAATFPLTFNNFDYQKRKVLIAPHGPDPVFSGVRGASPRVVLRAFSMLRHEEELAGYMIYLSNQHTDAHLRSRLNWKAFSSGWAQGVVEEVETGPGGHVYVRIRAGACVRRCAFYEPTGDLRRAARLLSRGDRVMLSGGVRRASSAHPKILNVERMEVVRLANGGAGGLHAGVYISSPRANRHLTKPLCRYGQETEGLPSPRADRWLFAPSTPQRAPARSRRAGRPSPLSPRRP
jgi:tRNA(Ile2)-agmatinylcytidine synthase